LIAFNTKELKKLSRFFKKAAFPALLATVVLVLAGSFSALADVGVEPTRPYWFNEINFSGDLADPHFFGQRTIQDINFDGSDYTIQFKSEYYIEPDHPASSDNVLKTEIAVLQAYNLVSQSYENCLNRADNIATVSNDCVQITGDTRYIAFHAIFESFINNSGHDLVGRFEWDESYLKLPDVTTPLVPAIEQPVWQW
jgi:hypothetical protein